MISSYIGNVEPAILPVSTSAQQDFVLPDTDMDHEQQFPLREANVLRPMSKFDRANVDSFGMSNRYNKQARPAKHALKLSCMRKTRGTANSSGRNRDCSNPLAYCNRVSGRGETIEKVREDQKENAPASQDPCLPIPAFLEVPPSICMARGQQAVCGWWRKNDASKVLGHLKECMQSLAQHCLLSAQSLENGTLRVLSLSDGNVNDCDVVPTSVLLAHAFASLDIDALPPGLEQVKIYGADLCNPTYDVHLQMQCKWLPPWLQLQHVRLDNKKSFKAQLQKFPKLSPHSSKFDIVLMRQGLCYCTDHSFDCLPPQKLDLVGVHQEDGSDGPSGTYILEKRFRHGRPSYRRGKFCMHWRPNRSDWAVVEDDKHGSVWANVVKDCGSPASAKRPWYVWDGKQEKYVIDAGVSCDVAGRSPWTPPAHACKCCAGISLDAAAMQKFMGRVADVLDERQPKAFALLHGGHYEGLRDRVEQFQSELQIAADLFNSSSPCIFVPQS